jgi:hypothetical protein
MLMAMGETYVELDCLAVAFGHQKFPRNRLEINLVQA